jgi:hypothetical protein
LRFASQFYTEIAELTSPENCVKIIEPFFNSPTTFRFLEHCFDRFFRAFLFHHTAAKDEGSEITTHGAFLLDCVTRSISLLPVQHLELLRHLKRKGWSSEAFADLVLVRFLWPATLTWLQSSPFSEYTGYMQKVLSGIASQKDLLGQFYRQLFRATSSYEIPKMFISFDLCFLLYHVCVHDIHLVVRALHSYKILPRGVSLQEFMELPRAYQFNWLWLQVYPKYWTQNKSVFHPLIFGNHSDFSADLLRIANAFECFLEHSRYSSRLSEWYHLIQDELDISSLRCDDFLRANPRFAASHKLSQRIVLCALDDAFLVPHTRELAEYADEWNIAVRGWQGVDLAALVADHGCAISRLWECIRTVRCLETVPVWERFPILLTVLLQVSVVLEKMPAPKETFGTVVKEMPGKVVIVSFIVFNGTVARQSGFFTDEERTVWLTFETIIYSMLKDQPVFTCQITSKIDDIAFHFENRK